MLKQVKAGGNFAELAKKNSEDPGSKARAANCWLIRRQDVPAYDKAAMALNRGRRRGW